MTVEEILPVPLTGLCFTHMLITARKPGAFLFRIRNSQFVILTLSYDNFFQAFSPL